jgi:hypothetical protein
MTADPLATSALAVCGVVWLVAALFLALGLLGRLPSVGTRNASALRLQLLAVLVLMTVAVLS